MICPTILDRMKVEIDAGRGNFAGCVRLGIKDTETGESLFCYLASDGQAQYVIGGLIAATQVAVAAAADPDIAAALEAAK